MQIEEEEEALPFPVSFNHSLPLLLRFNFRYAFTPSRLFSLSHMSSQNHAHQPHSPLLRPRPDAAARPPILALLLGRRGHPVMVRETAARELEERRADWSYSKPVVALDMTWNMAFVVVSAVMLGCTLEEKPNTPIRLWICGYTVQCLVHVALVWLEYRRRNARPRDEESGAAANLEDDSDDDEEVRFPSSGNSGFTKRCASMNTMASLLWWMVGFYWVVSGGDILLQDAPRLYWLVVVFLAFDVFFAIFCVVLACLIGIALCCCLPCIIAILYAVARQDGASESDLSVLPKYRFRMLSNEETPNEGGGKMVPMETNNDCLANERILSAEDAECCICISSYEDGAELHSLPCNHHFHSTCIVKWLKMNATCPLCKYNILKGNEHEKMMENMVVQLSAYFMVWEAFSTYPRTYDLLHAWTVFSDIIKEGLLIEMDRMLKPKGFIIVHDKHPVVDLKSKPLFE
ncbi:hypothetical protein RJT34_04814 [Clitoria ternatea]|uniref:RING-type E3 ubiquitin transferase n=1 Tax=Clitoria ternatea TaxID=43366 RepID=A0AAN9KPT3_CLITE